MKTLSIILIWLLTCLSVKAQEDLTASIKSDLQYGVTTPTKDTLFLANSDIGLEIKKVWDNDKQYDQKHPIIVIVSKEYLIVKVEQYIQNKKK
jgi:hypothetical protein